MNKIHEVVRLRLGTCADVGQIATVCKICAFRSKAIRFPLESDQVSA